MTPRFDWQADIRAHAAHSGVVLTDAVVEEMAEHLEDIYAGALRDGCSESDARARARTALEESTMDILGRLPRPVPPERAMTEVEAIAHASDGISLNMPAALR